MTRYDPPYEELKADATLLLRGFVNKVRCLTCNYRITWATDTEEKDGKCIYQTCICGKDEFWVDTPTDGLTFGMIKEVWKETFGDLFPTKEYNYVFERFINSLLARHFLIRESQTRKEVKKKK